MNITGINEQEQDKKTKKIMIGITILLVILLIISIALFITIYYLQGQKLKVKLDGKTIKTASDLFIFEEGKVYVSIKDIAPIINYKYYNGGYKQYSEDTTSCYLEGENEVCTFENESNKIYKTPVNELDYEFFTIDEEVRIINEKLYISSQGISVACNMQFTYNEKQNEITIYTLPYLVKYYTNASKYSAVSENFKNQKALLYNLLVVQNFENTTTNYDTKNIRYGIYTLTGEEVVGQKYTNIEFIESTKEFIVTTEENKVGIITSSGETKVRPQYDALKQIDKDRNLYLATSNNKKGIIEKNGKILIYLEYDEIGVDTKEFQNNNIKNSYVLFDNAIPVMQNGKWGMYDIKGNIIVPLEYDGIGCISKDKSLNNTLVIPEVKGIVFAQKTKLENNNEGTLYGIINSSGKTLVVQALETVYSITNNGREEYTMIHKNEKFDVIDYVKKYSNI